MTDAEKREAARQIYNKWNGKGKEDEDDRSFWWDILTQLLSVSDVTNRVQFQKKVIGPDGHTKRIDAYIPETKVLIEQKSLGIALDKPQAGHNGMTPFEQAKMYDNGLPHSEKSRWIILSNFAEIWIYDMDQKRPEPVKILLEELPGKYTLLDILINKEVKKINREMKLSLEAGNLVGKIYDSFLSQYNDPTAKPTQNSLNVLCVRLVFCLYAEDAGLFDKKDSFKSYIEQFEPGKIRRALIDLFEVLNTPIEDRSEMYLDDDLAAFPYVNGGLFEKEDIEIPKITQAIKDTLMESAEFDWSEISPTIFGAVFESTLNPETRRSGGMHYTSIENIHKVIDPLFLNDLKEELEKIKSITNNKVRDQQLRVFQNKLAGLRWLDPACGSGNFLTETYMSIRRLENNVLAELNYGQISFGFDIANPIKVGIDQFYGIEINDFAVTVAKTALWIAESQMMKETEDIVHMNLEFLPLKTNAYIVEGNALKMDWNKVISKMELSYIMGNPPFIGYTLQTNEQKKDIFNISPLSAKNIDYVSGWYFKAADYIQKTSIKCAFVSTNSITQGEQVESIWKPLLLKDIILNFAHKTFIWDSEANIKAHVHCVIVGFSTKINFKRKKIIYDDNSYTICSNISPYLIDAPNVIVGRRNKPLCNVPEINIGNMPIDNGNYLFTKEEMENFLVKEPQAKKYFKLWLDARGFINNKPRYCLWLGECTPAELQKMPECMKRIKAVKEFRLSSKRKATLLIADTPTHFATENMPLENYIAIPEVSSQKRRYIPMGYLSSNVLCSNKLRIMPNASLLHFGVLESNVHMAWTRVVCGRLKSDYDYSIKVVYNNFPWPSPTDAQKIKIEQTAQGILDARALYPDSSLADLYDPLTMPPELRKAHTANDKAVMQAYGFNIKNTSEADCVAALMKMYQELTQ